MGELHGHLTATTFGGAPFQQTWNDLPIWEKFFNAFPCKSIVDWGTGQGGGALFFAAQAFIRGMRYSTFDRDELCDKRTYAALTRLGANAYGTNIFENVDFVQNVLAACPRPLVLFCDNGDKPREVRTFAPMLLNGDFLAVHDWGSEIRADDIPSGFEMILREECESTDSVTRFFSVVQGAR